VMFISILVIAAFYFLVGGHLALHYRPIFWARARETWTIPEYAIGSVKARMTIMALFWPVALPITGADRALSRLATEGDPRERDRRHKEAQQRIAQLERELGINADSQKLPWEE
jgi:hypothetical protein